MDQPSQSPSVPWHQSTGFKLAAPLVIAATLLVVANLVVSPKSSPRARDRFPLAGTEILDEAASSGGEWLRRADRSLGRGVDILLDGTESTLDKAQQHWERERD